MDNTIAARLLSLLRQSAGQKLSLREINAHLRDDALQKKGKTGKSRGSSKRRNRHTYHRRYQEAFSAEKTEALLAELEKMGMVNISAKQLIVRQPFLLTGRVSLSPHGAAFISISGSPTKVEDVFVSSHFTRNALPGDRVLLSLKNKRRDRFEGRIVTILERSRKEFRMKLLPPRGSGVVIGKILDLNGGHILALVNSSSFSLQERPRVKPGRILIVSLSGQQRRHLGINFHEASFLRFEEEGDIDPDLVRIFMKYDLSLNYPACKDLKQIALKKITKDKKSKRDRAAKKREPNFTELVTGKDAQEDFDRKNRKDLRELYTITIDGENSKDFDDALSLVVRGKKTAQLYVHIADVSYYVAQDGDLDSEACKRGTSYYLLDQVIPMLPPKLSEDLCSLIEDHNRLAVTAEMEVNLKNGKIGRTKFYRSIIRVNKRLTYAFAEEQLERALAERLDQAALNKLQDELQDEIQNETQDGIQNEAQNETQDGTQDRTQNEVQNRAQGEAQNEVGKDRYQRALLAQLWRLTELQQRRRREAGKIDFDIPETKVIMGAERKVKMIARRPRTKCSMLIEECMLSANSAVAAFLRENRAHTIYRVHEQIETEKIDALNAFCASFNIPYALKDSSHNSIKRLLSAVDRGLAHPNLKYIFQMQLLRSFQQAYYSPQPKGHWGLSFENYCHFTSPIRRYPDLVVHRTLISLLERQRGPAAAPYSSPQVAQIAIKSSEAERKAVDAERDILRLKIIRYLQQEKIRRLAGFLSNFKSDRVFVNLEEFPIEAVVEAQHLIDEGELIPIDAFTLFVSKTARPARLGERWNLEIERLDEEELRIFCRPLWREDEAVVTD